MPAEQAAAGGEAAGLGRQRGDARQRQDLFDFRPGPQAAGHLLHQQDQPQPQDAAADRRRDQQHDGGRTILLERNQRRRDDAGVGDLQALLLAGLLGAVEELLEQGALRLGFPLQLVQPDIGLRGLGKLLLQDGELALERFLAIARHLIVVAHAGHDACELVVDLPADAFELRAGRDAGRMPVAVQRMAFRLGARGFRKLRAQARDGLRLQRFRQRGWIGRVPRDLLDPLAPRPGVGRARSRQSELLGQILDLAADQLVALGDVDHAVGGFVVGNRALGVADLAAHRLDALAEPTRRPRRDLGLGGPLIIEVGVGDGARDQRRLGGGPGGVAHFKHVGEAAPAHRETVLKLVDQAVEPSLFGVRGSLSHEREQPFADLLQNRGVGEIGVLGELQSLDDFPGQCGRFDELDLALDRRRIRADA